MNSEEKKYRKTYPNIRHFIAARRKSYLGYKNITTALKERKKQADTVPDCYEVCNTTTVDSDIRLNVLFGELPQTLEGNLYICQCLGSPEAFMVGDTNLVKLSFDKDSVQLKNRLMWNPVALAKVALQDSTHRFDHCSLMFMSPGLGIFSYTEGMYVLPDGRLGITSDVDRPWIVDRENLRIQDPLGKREDWLPMVSGEQGKVMGTLFSGYGNSHVIYTDTHTNELFLVSYQCKQDDGTHPCKLMKWDGSESLQSWFVVDENGEDIRVMQSIHELIFTKDYILLADTAFATGDEMISLWKNAPLPNPKTVVYLVDRRHLREDVSKVVAKRIEIEEACIHLIADYENPEDILTLYMLHTPATNTAEIIRSYDTDLEGKRFSKHLIGYGTLPVLDLSSLGKHQIDMKTGTLLNSEYIRDEQYCWGPYMYTYMGRQTRPFQEQDLFVMFKGFHAEMLPKRIYEAYKDTEDRKVPLSDMCETKRIACNNSIARIDKEKFKIADAYTLPDKVLLYTISCLEDSAGKGYLLAAVAGDVPENTESSGHEYWIFEANDLQKGPICKLGHKSLNNSILFHTVYLSKEQEAKLDEKEIRYHVNLREDYPAKELSKWSPEVEKTFEEIIWPYFDRQDSAQKTKAERMAKQFAKKRVKGHAGKEHLIGEEQVEDAPAFAERMIAEAERMFQTTGWRKESKQVGVLVESKPIDGSLKDSGVLVTRASGIVGANADKLFEYLSSAEGYAVIDPVSKAEDHKKEPLERYEWCEACRLEAAVASTNLPMLPPEDFVVLNAIDPKRRIFASKSIQHSQMPGASKYTDAPPPENGHERALNTFVVKIVPLRNNKCRVLCINYADMSGKTSASINNLINTKVFFNPLYKRMRKAALSL